METKTEVIFREEKNGSIIAVFPYLIADPSGNVMCYTTQEQHNAMCWDYFLKNTKPTINYNEIKKELEFVGYDLKIIKRRNYDKYLKEYYKLININK